MDPAGEIISFVHSTGDRNGDVSHLRNSEGFTLTTNFAWYSDNSMGEDFLKPWRALLCPTDQERVEHGGCERHIGQVQLPGSRV